METATVSAVFIVPQLVKTRKLRTRRVTPGTFFKFHTLLLHILDARVRAANASTTPTIAAVTTSPVFAEVVLPDNAALKR